MVAVPCEIYSRVVGYYRPIDQWNPGKQAEFWDRVPYNIPIPQKNSYVADDKKCQN
jgi:ribonucleoside-triphosphate reductase